MLTTDRHEASRGLFATAELLVSYLNSIFTVSCSSWTPYQHLWVQY